MEDVLQAVGIVGLIILVVIGLLSGWLASVVTGGRNRARYMALGLAGALITPFLLAALGIGALAVGSIAAILVAALVGAIVVVIIGKLIFD